MRAFSSVLAGLFIAAVFPSPSSAQDGPGELIEQLDEYLSSKEEDGAIMTLGELSAAFSELEEKDKARGKIVKAIERALQKPRRDGSTRIHEAAVEALIPLGESGTKSLVRSLKKKTVKDHAEVLKLALEGIGQSENLKYIKTLAGYLTHKEGSVISGAAAGLAHYNEAKERIRKDIVDDLVRTYSSLDGSTRAVSQARQQGGGGGGGGGGAGGGGGGAGAGIGSREAARKKLSAASGGIEKALAALTSTQMSGAERWAKWFRENKKQRWDHKS